MRLISILIILFLFVVIKTGNAQRVSKIPDADKSEIIKSILSEEFPLKDAETVCISTENIPKSMLKKFPKISGVKFLLSAPDKIREFDCGLEYYFFGGFQKKHSSILVSFGNNYRDLSTAGRHYSYCKVKGKWRGKIAGFFMSQT